jgi:hypothetical protein
MAAAGYRPISIDLSELAKGGGSVKCCTQELRLFRESGAVDRLDLTQARKEPSP